MRDPLGPADKSGMVKRFFIGVALIALSASAAFAEATPQPHAAATHPSVAPHVVILHYAVAPADEYFGRLKMSILGIRNTIRDMGLKADADPEHASDRVLGSMNLCEDAMHDWEKKYPHDSWIPAAIFSLERLYAKIDSDAARAKAKIVMLWLVHDYPASSQAKIGKRELASNSVGAKPATPPASTVAGGADDTTH